VPDPEPVVEPPKRVGTRPPCDPRAAERIEVRARHIVIGATVKESPSVRRVAQQRAVEARNRLLAGESFEALEREYSSGAVSRGVNGGDLGYFKRKVMLPQFEAAAFCQRIGEIGPVVETVFGYHIIQVTDVRY
jgi:parvulin-like peptidyl-prolyl isomerase